MTAVTSNGLPIALSGALPAIGSTAPDFLLVDKDLNDLTLKTFSRKAKILYTVPSLDTPVCATSSKRFDELLKDLDEVAVCSVSADLPFAMRRFCNTQVTSCITPLSLMRTRKFAEDYGVLITGGRMAGLAARAVIVIDRNDRVVYTELVKDMAKEPDYASAVAAAKACIEDGSSF